EESAHIYKQIILDEQARPITRHQIWLTNIKAYDNAIPPGRSDIARFRFRIPDRGSFNCGLGLGDRGLKNGEPLSLTLRARVNYRRVNQEYTNYVLQRQQRQLTLPVVRMAEAEMGLSVGDHSAMHKMPNPQSPSPNPQSSIPRWKRWNDYGIGLLEQAQYGAAAAAFSRAFALDPANSSLLVNNAIAEMRTERFGPEREQWQKASALLDRALTLRPNDSRARYFRSLIWRANGRAREAADELSALAAEYPQDREVQRQLGQTLYTLGIFDRARQAMEIILRIDPTDAGAYQMLSPIYLSEGRQREAGNVHAL